MNKNVKQNIVGNYVYMCGIDKTDLHGLEATIEKGNYYVYRHICKLIYSCNVKHHQNYFILEIDIKQNQKLARDICTKLWTQKLGC